MRGFNDKFQELETYAGTASRAGQRTVNTIASEHEGIVLFSFDVSQAFAKGMALEIGQAYGDGGKTRAV